MGKYVIMSQKVEKILWRTHYETQNRYYVDYMLAVFPLRLQKNAGFHQANDNKSIRNQCISQQPNNSNKSYQSHKSYKPYKSYKSN